MPDPLQTLAALKSKLLEIQHLKGAAALLSWDQETHMPAGGGQTRAEQLATLQTLAHAKFVSPEIENLLLHHIDPTTGLATTDAIDDASKALLRETGATSPGQKNFHPISSIAWSANVPWPSRYGPRRAGAMTSCTFFPTCKRSSP